MPREKLITAEKLEELGASRLAQLVAEHCERDAGLRKKVRLALAAGRGAGSLAAAIDQRLSALRRSGRFLDWQEAKPLRDELDGLRRAIAGELAATDPRAAAERLAALVELADGVYGRVDDSSGAIAAVFRAAAEDLGRLWASFEDRDPRTLARWVFEAFRRDEYSVKRGLIAAFGDALGPEGQAELQRHLEGALAALPERRGRDWRADLDRRRLTFGLEQLADLRRDVDGFIAAGAGEAMHDAKRFAVAARLIAAGRAEEALAWLVECKGGYDDEAPVDLSIAALDQLGRTAEAQAARWSWFEATLSLEHLREHLKRLPDFADFEAERKAVAIASGHASAVRALAFLTALPDLPAADALVRARLAELDGRAYEVLTPAAERLAGRYPASATLLYRRLAESILERASSKQYGYAARDVRNAAGLANRVTDESGIESHDAFLARLQREHGRKYSFWQLLEGE